MSEVRITVNADGSWVHHTACSYDLSEAPTVIKALQSCVLNMAEDSGKRVDDIVREIQAEHDSAAEVARLRKLFDDAGQGEYNVLALVDYYQDAEIKALAEVARLRKALERIANGVWPSGSIDHMRDIARVALGRTTT